MKRVFITILVLCMYSTFSRAQNVLVHEKKIYVSPDKTIYYNKALPVYFFVSTSPDPKGQLYLLRSETTPKYANPMYFDTEGRNTLRSPSAVDTITKQIIEPQIDVEYQVYVDSKPPSTKLAYNKQRTKTIKGVHYVSDSLAVSVEGTDELSGLQDVYISIDKADYKPLKNALVLDKEREYLLSYYGVDNTGNIEKPKEIGFAVDKTPPVSKLDIAGIKYENILPGNDFLEISAADNMSGIRHIWYSIDDSVFRIYTGKINTASLAQGDHKLFYYATDEVNNNEKVSSYTFYVDKTPPQVIEEILGKTFVANGKEFSAGTSTLKITSFDNRAGVKEIYYSINKAPYVKYEKPIALAGFKGDLLVTSYAVDNVGNKSLSDASNSRKTGLSYIDLSAPWVGHTFKGPHFSSRDTMFVNQKTAIVLEAKDNESGINRTEYQVDSSDLQLYKSPLYISKEGYHHISVFGYDNTENLTRQSFGVQVDTTGPEIFERFSSRAIGSHETDGTKLDEYAGPVVVFLSATDAVSGFASLSFELNGGPVQPYLREIRGFLPGKKNTIKVKATDQLGNKTEKTIAFYLK